MTNKPINPKGTCFPSVARIMCFPTAHPANSGNFAIGNFPSDLIACHGLLIGTDGKWIDKIIAHAWIEFKDKDGIFNGKKNINIAYDPIWGTFSLVNWYYKHMKVQYVKKYNKEQFIKLLCDNSMVTGPWDKKILTEMTPYEPD